jgi:signal transduction histidine kinase
MTAAGRTRPAGPSGYRRRVPPRRFLLRDAHLAALDVVAAVGLLAALAPAARTSVPVAAGVVPYRAPDWVAWVTWLVAATVALPVVVRRRWPVGALAVVLAGSSAAAVMSLFPWPHSAGALGAAGLVLYSTALTAPRRTAVVALAVSLAVTAGAALLAGSAPIAADPFGLAPASRLGDTVTQAAFGWLALGAVWGTGLAVRQRREYAARSAEQAARQALSDERLRIARELHDVVAHSMSLIAVKAGTANHVADERPEEARDALRLIETTSRAALVEMRRVLGVLRAGGDLPAELEPVPGLAGLATLADRAASAGVDVDLQVRGSAALPEGVDLSAYRIVQEALTNVVKHAGAVPCRVDVTVAPDEVRIEVTDDGPSAASRPATRGPNGGHGLLGMRERVAMYGGSFAAGPRPAGGFAVHATLPYEATADQDDR